MSMSKDVMEVVDKLSGMEYEELLKIYNHLGRVLVDELAAYKEQKKQDRKYERALQNQE